MYVNDTDMDLLNGMFRAELQKFKSADEATRMRVVDVIAKAGALDWLIEISKEDSDPQIRAYAALAQEYKSEG